MHKAEVISTGSELMQGLYADTNAQHLSHMLTAIGFEITHHHAVGDVRERLDALLRRAVNRAEVVVITGGLGPTEDDVTREVVAQVAARDLVKDLRTEQMIRERFKKRHIPLPSSNLSQALYPDGAVPMYNSHGTALGFIVHPTQDRAAIVALPGPLREWRPMFERDVQPFLKEAFPSTREIITHVIHTIGLPESGINDAIREFFHMRDSVDITLLAKPGNVDVRITVKGLDPVEAHKIAEETSSEIVERLGEECVYGFDETTLEEAVGEMLKQRGLTVALAESCTGGLVSMRLTNVPGSSLYFREGLVTYSNEAKLRRLGVKKETLERSGAVSEPAAREMAERVRSITRADIGLSITGIAGPGGGSKEKPVGLVYFALSAEKTLHSTSTVLHGNRHENRLWSSDRALDMLRRYLSSLGGKRPLDTQRSR